MKKWKKVLSVVCAAALTTASVSPVFASDEEPVFFSDEAFVVEEDDSNTIEDDSFADIIIDGENDFNEEAYEDTFFEQETSDYYPEEDDATFYDEIADGTTDIAESTEFSFETEPNDAKSLNLIEDDNLDMMFLVGDEDYNISTSGPDWEISGTVGNCTMTVHPGFENNWIKYSIDDMWIEYQHMVTSVIFSDGMEVVDGLMYFESLTSVYIPESVKVIQENAFSNCVNLESVMLPESVEEIGTGAFLECTKLTSINLENSKITEIKNRTFESCKSLKNITLPSTVCRIGDNAFDCCTALESVTMQTNRTFDDIYYIGKYAFDSCYALENIVLPNNKLYIGSDAFDSCIKLKQIYFPEKTNYLDGCFSKNDSLNSITFAGMLTDVAEDTLDVRIGKAQYNIPYRSILDTNKLETTCNISYFDIHYLILDLSTREDFSVVATAQPYTGSAITPDISVYLGNGEIKLVKDEDYTLKCSNNTNVGTANYEITGIGYFTGTVTGTFNINKANISETTITGIVDKTYHDAAITQTPTVKFGTKTLKEGTDYTISYSNNTAIGTATIKFQGIGNFQGTLSKTFKIVAAEQRTYTLKFDANGGTSAPASITQKSTDTSVDLTIPATTPIKSGYEFVAWNTKVDGTGTVYQKGTTITLRLTAPTVTLYAQYVKKYTYKLTFDANGGSNAPADVTKVSTSTSVSLVIPDAVPTRSGYYFTEWNTKADGTGTAYSPGDSITRKSTAVSLKLYARYIKVVNYVIAFNANGGSTPPAAISTTGSTTITITLPSTAPTRKGYSFKGWNTKKDGSGTTYKKSEEITLSSSAPGITLYAMWAVINKFKLLYYTNGGSDGPAALTKGTSGKSIKLTVSDKTPVRNGYDFTGWNTKADGSGATYHGGDTVLLKIATPYQILYAQWMDPVTHEVPKPIPEIEVVKLNKTAVTMRDKQTCTLKATLTMSDGSSTTGSWSSSNTAVAKVSKKGVVTAIKAGTAIITVKKGSLSATCKVTVKPRNKLKAFTLNYTTKTIGVGKSFTLKVKSVTPSNASVKLVKSYVSSNKAVAKVTYKTVENANGILVERNAVITGLKKGKATIIATSEDGSYKVKCVVTVK